MALNRYWSNEKILHEDVRQKISAKGCCSPATKMIRRFVNEIMLHVAWLDSELGSTRLCDSQSVHNVLVCRSIGVGSGKVLRV